MVICAKENQTALHFVRLNPTSLKLIVFPDAWFAGNRNSTSQLGYITFVSDKSGAVIPMLYKSYRARHVTRFVMSAELIAFKDMFDADFTLREEPKHVHPRLQVPMQLLIDSKTLFKVISKRTRTSEKRLMDDVACAREGFPRMESRNIGFFRSSCNLTDGLTKSMNQAGLLSVMKTRTYYEVDQCIIRGKPEN